MEKDIKSRLRKAVPAMMAAFLFLILFVWMLGQNQTEAKQYEFGQGWSIWLNSREMAQKDLLSDYKFSNLKPMDEVVLKNRIPDGVGENQALTFLVYHSAIRVEIEDTQIYEYGRSYLDIDWLVGSGYHVVHLPDDAGGKEIRVTLTVGEPNAFTSLLAPVFCETGRVYPEFAHKHMVTVFICIFLTLLGAILALVSAGAMFYNRVFVRVLYIGLFSFLMGIWSMCNMKVLQIFSVDLAANTTVEYMSLYIAPIVFFCMVEEINQNAGLWRRRIIRAVGVVMMAFTVLAIALHFTNTLHFPRLLGCFHVLGGISLLIVAICSIEKGKKRDLSERALLFGILLLGSSVALDLVRFNIQKYMLQDEKWLTVSVIPIGTLIFVIMLLISYMYYFYRMIVTKAKQDWLEKHAYYDELCHIFNRVKCNEVFAELDETKKSYALINMDLNGLKAINDTYGHLKGDLLLQEFAAIIQKAFEKTGEVYRMGGDEFLVIVPGRKIPQISGAVAKMEALEQERSAALDFTIDASYGIAKSDECSPSKTKDIYALADQRMYAMKVEKKKGRAREVPAFAAKTPKEQ